jgi:hypothetical protein
MLCHTHVIGFCRALAIIENNPTLLVKHMSFYPTMPELEAAAIRISPTTILQRSMDGELLYTLASPHTMYDHQYHHQKEWREYQSPSRFRAQHTPSLYSFNHTQEPPVYWNKRRTNE